MTQNSVNNILIIGGPNAGKTHFGAQLYGRLSTRTSAYKITSPPEDLTVFKDVLDKLNEGLSSGHTEVKSHNILKLDIEDGSGTTSTFSFPDYGGEQVKAVVADRKVNETWKDQIEKSNAWMLFLRLDQISPNEDVVNRGLPDMQVLKERNEDTTPMILSAAAFYTELLQILLFVKKIAIRDRTIYPKLTVAISCWDLLSEEEKKQLPKEVLYMRLPALMHFIESNWSSTAHNIIGLSSLGHSLSDKVVDTEYLRKGPENFGYVITHDGVLNTDLTLSISSLLGA